MDKYIDDTSDENKTKDVNDKKDEEDKKEDVGYNEEDGYQETANIFKTRDQKKACENFNKENIIKNSIGNEKKVSTTKIKKGISKERVIQIAKEVVVAAVMVAVFVLGVDVIESVGPVLISKYKKDKEFDKYFSTLKKEALNNINDIPIDEYYKLGLDNAGEVWVYIESLGGLDHISLYECDEIVNSTFISGEENYNHYISLHQMINHDGFDSYGNLSNYMETLVCDLGEKYGDDITIDAVSREYANRFINKTSSSVDSNNDYDISYDIGGKSR